MAVVYDGWRQARYGQWLYEHLQRDCEEVAIKPVANTPFHGRLIDATVITAVKGSNASTVKKVRRRDVRAVTGSTLWYPRARTGHQSSISDTNRGLRLKQAGFFLCPRSEAPELGATPFLKKIRHITGFAADPGHPEAALLVARDSNNELCVEELRRRLVESAEGSPNGISQF